MDDYILALDFGGTKLSAALTTPQQITPGGQRWLDVRRTFSPEGGDAGFDIETMVAMADDLLDGHSPLAVGVSFGGPVDFRTGTVRLSHHVPGWENTPLQALLAEKYGAIIRVDNDANAAALGEYHFGAGRGCDNLMYITISTGVGGGWILNGNPWRGHEGMAGEIGHTVVEPEGPVCLCGKRGCVERLASGPYMAQDYVSKLRRIDVKVDMQVTGETVARKAVQGEDLARRFLERSAWALGAGIGNAANLINPNLFVLGGGVTKSGSLWWEKVRQTAYETALPEVHFDVVPAALGDEAPLWGAVALVRDMIDV